MASDTDAALIAAVSTFLGTDHLHCKHCKRDRPLEAFLSSLKKCWKGDKLSRTPRTCDTMQAVNKSQNSANNKIHNTKTSIRRYEARKLEYIAAGKDVSDIEARLVDLHVKLTAAIISKNTKGADDSDDETDEESDVGTPASAAAIDDPFGIFIESAPAPAPAATVIHDSFGIFSLAADWNTARNPFDD